MSVRAAVCVVLAAGCPGLPTFAAELFGPAAVSIRVGESPGVVIVVDLDSDGALDLAVPSFDGDSVSVLLGDGRGGFARVAEQVATGDQPFSIATGDFNTDGNADLAVANLGGDSVSVLLGDGEGRLSQPAGEVPVGNGPSSIVAEDFDGNGADDLAVANRFDGTVSVLLGDGRGGFAQIPRDVAVGVEPFSIATGDFDADGNMDLALCNFGPAANSVSVLLGDGTGGFVRTPVSDIPVDNRPISVAVGDFDRDGAADLAVATLFGDTVRLLRGDGRGGFALSREGIAVGSLPFSVTARDLDGDGAADLAVTNLVGNSISLLLNDGTGRFARSSDIATGQAPRSAAVGDFNRDGAADLVVSNFDDDSVRVFLGDGIGDFSRNVEIGVGLSPRAVAVSDLDRDGFTDLAVASFDGDAIRVLLGDGTGRFAPQPDVTAGDGPLSLALGDLDGDGSADLAVANLLDDSVSVLVGNGRGGFSRASDLAVGRGPVSVAVANLNGDPAADLVVANQSAGQLEATASILLGDGRGGFTRLPDVGVGGSGSEPTAIVAADLDGDGHTDLAVTKLHADSVSVLLGNGRGGFARLPDVAAGDEPSSLIVADLNADGVPDLALACSGSSTIEVLFGNGAGGFTAGAALATGRAPHALTAADFNRDGAQDLAVSSLGEQLVSVFLGDGSGGFSRVPEDLAVGPFPLSIAAADFDGNGVPDLAVANESVTDELGDAVTLLYDRLPFRADLNGTNRVDGFDIAMVGRLFGVRSTEATYRRSADVNLDGLIDGDDLALVSERFGDLNRSASPLRATLETTVPATPGTITVQPLASEGDLIAVEIRVHDNGFSPVAAADFALAFDPPPGTEPVIEVLDSYEPGSYLAGGATPIYVLGTSNPGQVRVRIVRIPNSTRSGAGEYSLLSLFFRARRAGQVELRFAPSGNRLLDADGVEVPGVKFVSGARVTVEEAAGGPPGQKIGFAPELLDFAEAAPGDSARKTLLISNFGFSELHVSSVDSPVADLGSFAQAAFTVSAFGLVELPVWFVPRSRGLFSVDLVVASDDPLRPALRVPVVARSGLAVGLTPMRLEFGAVPVGVEKHLALRLTNREDAPLTLTAIRSSDPTFVPQAGFQVLEPGATGIVDVRFLPAAPGDIGGLVTMEFEGKKTVVLSLRGVGESKAAGLY